MSGVNQLSGASLSANPLRVPLEVYQELNDSQMLLLLLEAIVSRLNRGVSGTFTTVDSKTITIENGIVKSIV